MKINENDSAEKSSDVSVSQLPRYIEKKRFSPLQRPSIASSEVRMQQYPDEETEGERKKKKAEVF